MVDFRITWTLRLMGLRAGTRPAPTRCLFIFRIHHSFKVLSNLSEKSGIGVFCLGVFPLRESRESEFPPTGESYFFFDKKSEG